MPRFAGAGEFRRRNQPEDADEDEDELLEFESLKSLDRVLWLIDAGPKMHDTLIPLGGDDPDLAGKQVSMFHKALNAAFLFQRRKLVNSPADHCGILLFNTRDTKVQDAGKNVAYPHSMTVQSIAQVSVPPISDLKDDLQDSLDNGPEYFRKKYAPAEKQTRIHHALGNAEAMLLQHAKTDEKRIFFVTNEDRPMEDKKGKSEQHRLALEKVNSMSRRGIGFEPFLISTDEKPFELSHFYGVVFGTYADEEDAQLDLNSSGSDGPGAYRRQRLNATTKFEHLDGEVGARETPKRVIFSVPMTLGSNFTIGVKGYCTLVKATKGMPVKVKAMPREDEDDPIEFKEILTETFLTCTDTGRELDRKNVDVAFNFGTEPSMRAQVRFTKAELERLRTCDQVPSIRILGFKPMSELRFYENTTHAYFIYPTDQQLKNSQRAFTALLESMASKQRMAIAIFMPRKNMIPKFAAILPQREEREDESGGQIEPPGMYVVPLPYADDIREPPRQHREPTILANEEQVLAARALVQKYTKVSAFNPDFFPNPALNHHYKVLLAVAFGDEIPESPVDILAKPNYNQIAQRVGSYIETWNDAVDADERLHSRAVALSGTSGNGKAGSAGGSPGKKRPNAGGFSLDEEPELKRQYAEGKIGANNTLVKLKAICEYYRLPTQGKKAELLERVAHHLSALDAREDVKQEGRSQRVKKEEI